MVIIPADFLKSFIEGRLNRLSGGSNFKKPRFYGVFCYLNFRILGIGNK